MFERLYFREVTRQYFRKKEQSTTGEEKVK